MSTSKRIISLLLALVMVLGMLPWDTLGVEAAGLVETVRLSIESAKASGANPSAMAENNSDPTETTAPGAAAEVTRAQWVQELVKTFSMTVEEDNYPDNYFSDLTGDEEYYRDILVAVEFGVIVLEAGLPFEPEAAATREFCAHTLNFCLGYQLNEDSEYTFTESQTAEYPDDIQIAINRDWFELENGAFLPELAVTAAEKNNMIQDAAEVLASDVIDPDYQNSYEFTEDVIELSEQMAVYWESEDQLSLLNPDYAIQKGDIFVVYEDGFPLVCKAENVTKTGSLHTITITSLNINDYLVSIDAQGTSVTDLAEFEPAEDVDAIYILEDGSEVYSVQDAGTRDIKSICLAKEFKGYKVYIEVYDMVLNWHSKGGLFNDLDTSAVVTGRAYFDVSIPFGASVSDFSDVLTLGTVPIEPFGRISVTADLSIDGSVSFDYGTKFSVGISYNDRDKFRIPMTFEKTRFSMCVEANVKAGISVSAGLTGIPLLSASCRATVGLQVNFTARYRGEDSTPKLCIHTDAWLYCSAYASATVGIKKWESTSKTWSGSVVIWDRNHSPVRSSSHFEDGTLVSKCTCGDFDYVRYYSSGSSRYANGGVSAVSNSPVYTYTVDEDGNATITGFSGNVSSISIPLTIDGHPVTAVGKNAFSGKTSLYSVTLPNGVVSIGGSAFKGCSGPRDIRLPDTIVTISSNAFQNCTSLTSIDIPDIVTSIGGAAFANCTNLQNVRLPKSLKSMTAHAFYNCDALTSIEIPASLEETDDFYIYSYSGDYVYGPFYGCDGLKNVTFEEGATCVANGLFAHCPGIETIVIPDTVTVIESQAFYDCKDLSNVTFSSALTQIGSSAFRDCKTLPTVDITDTVTSIGGAAFANCANLQNVHLPKSLKSMTAHAFYNCDALTSIEIPASLEETDDFYIYSYAGDYVYGPFYGCDGLKNVTFETGSTRIAKGLFANCSGLETIVIPDTVATIGYQAFYNCDSLTEMVIPDTVTMMGNSVFADSATLATVIWSAGMTQIPESTFSRCTALTIVNLPCTVTVIYKNAFNNCDSLVTFTMPDSVTTMNENVFYDCDALTDVHLSEKLQKINNSTFYDCDALTSITIPYGVTSIGSSAFYDCDALETVTMANSVTSLGTNVFYHNDVLKNVTLSRNLTTIPSGTFKECAELSEIVIPYFTTTISDNAFNSSPKLTKVVVRNKLTSISSSAFSYADRTIFYGPTGSYAKTWCADNGYKFNENTAAATAVTLADKSVTIAKGKTHQLNFDIAPIDFAETITFRSSNTDVVTVDETGKLTAVGTGSATIRINVGSASASCRVTVT